MAESGLESIRTPIRRRFRLWRQRFLPFAVCDPVQYIIHVVKSFPARYTLAAGFDF